MNYKQSSFGCYGSYYDDNDFNVKYAKTNKSRKKEGDVYTCPNIWCAACAAKLIDGECPRCGKMVLTREGWWPEIATNLNDRMPF